MRDPKPTVEELVGKILPDQLPFKRDDKVKLIIDKKVDCEAMNYVLLDDLNKEDTYEVHRCILNYAGKAWIYLKGTRYCHPAEKFQKVGGVIGRCKECLAEMTNADQLPEPWTNIYECSKCSHPNSKEDML